MKKIFLLACMLLVISPTICLSITQEDLECVMGEWEKFRIQARKYVWGDWDCSKAWAEAHSNCGIAVIRCTAKDYAEGRCGFESIEVDVEQTRRGDTVFWSWGKHNNSVKRPYGHIGQTEDSDTVYHNSSSKKHVVKSDFLDVLIGDLEDKVRRWKMEDDPDPIEVDIVSPPDIKVEAKEPKKEESLWSKWFK